MHELGTPTCSNSSLGLTQSLQVITGNPGTGKTTFVRLCYEFLRAYGILPSDHPIFVERSGLELKGQFLGDTAPRVKRAVREALGGCLFIDEVSSSLMYLYAN